ncbi:MAG: 30S ribosomal protein S16 [Bdellovibrionales bacterium]|nr:30S ribosomal protein S16 [Bdellovibrionales bacterium]
MSVAIRLQRHGRTKRPFYRIVATDKENKRDGRFLETLGTIDTLLDPPMVRMDQERVKYWIGVGAQPSHTVETVIKREIPGYLEEIVDARRARIRAQRSKRKARQKASS